MEVQVTRAAAIMRNLEPLTVGMSKAVPVKLTLSADWDGLAKTAIFKAGTTQIDVTDAEWVDATTVFVPPEVLTKAGSRVQFGLYGTDSDDAIVIPTIWVNLGKVQPAPDPSGDPTTDPTLPVWAQLQGEMIDGAEIDAEGHLILTLHNGETIDAGSAVGPQGETGETGPQGPQGIQGPQGPAGIGAEIIDFTATLTDWDTMDAASTDVPFADIVQKVQDGAVSARLALTVNGTTYNVNLQGFSVGNAVSFYGIGQIPETLRVIALLGAEGYWFAATETLGGGGTSDYDQLSNRPQINGNTLTGNKTAAQLGLGTYSKPSGGIPASDLASGVIPTVPTKVSDLTNDSGFVNAAGAAAAAPVQSVNGQTGAVSLTIPTTPEDIGAAPEVTEVTVTDNGYVFKRIEAGRIYHFTGDLISLELELGQLVGGSRQYHFDFLAGDTPPTLTFTEGMIPVTVTMPDGFAIEANTRNEIDILNGYGVMMTWPI